MDCACCRRCFSRRRSVVVIFWMGSFCDRPCQLACLAALGAQLRRRRSFLGFSAAGSEDFRLSLLRYSPKAGNPRRGARADHLRDCVRPCPLGNGDCRQGEGLGQSLDWPDEPAGKISAAHERAWLRDRVRTARDLGQINDLFRRCVRLQVSVDEFEQAHPVRLGGSMNSC
jgi:hypothetical protein